MDDFITIKCPGCGRDMQLDNKTRSGSCPHCASRVNYRDAESLPAHISAEADEKEQFADSAEVARKNPEEGLPESDEIVPDKKTSYLTRNKISAITSIIFYLVILIGGTLYIMSLPGMTENLIKTPFFIVIVVILVIQIGLNIFKWIKMNKAS